jgi:hypothetical protein
VAEDGVGDPVALLVAERELLGEVGEDAQAVEPASIMKSTQRSWLARSRSPESVRVVGTTGKTPA